MTLRRAPSTARPDSECRDRGAVLMVTTIAMILILSVAALAVDFAVVRDRRTSGQQAADAAASAAALTLAEIDSDARDACETAIDYLDLNGVPDTFNPPLNCAMFPTTCENGVTSGVTESASNSSFTIQITYPVENGDPTMTSSALGATGQTISQADGEPCDRIAVQIKATHKTFFAGVVGVDAVETTVRTVALANPSAFGERALNLLLLERHDCDVLEASGAGGVGGVVVGGVLNPATGKEFPGTLSIDSDGTGSGCNNDGTIDVNGTNGLVRADGDPCAFELTPGVGDGCGDIEVFAPGTPGCNPPACTSAGTVAPDPRAAPEILTRAPVDFIFNCKSAYPVAYDIDGCPYTATTPPYIDQLVAAVGSAGKPTPGVAWNDYSPTYPCSINGSDVVTVPQGNWRVNCDLSIKGELFFEGGNVVFDGDVSLQADGLLDINSSNTTPSLAPPTDILDISKSSSTAAFVYFRDGEISKAGQASVHLTNVMSYFSSTSTIDLGGGSGSVAMIAPTEGPFKNLAMWSESSLDVDLAGQANIALEGVFFTPFAQVNYQGNGGQVQVAAQFISLKLRVGGNGRLFIKPRFDRLVTFPDTSSSTLIR